MRERLAMPQAAAFFQRRFDVGVRVEHALAAEQLDVLVEMTAGSDRRVDLEAVPDTGIEIVGAVARSRMHGAGAGLERDVLAEDAD